MNEDMPTATATVTEEGSGELWVCDSDGRKLEDEYLLGDVVGRWVTPLSLSFRSNRLLIMQSSV